MGIVCDSKKPTPSKEGNLILQTSKFIIYKTRRVNNEDKDFGEWVYAHNEKEISVILLRYSAQEAKSIISALLNLLESKGTNLFGKFTTITTKKIRIRALK
jgi:hypothetical protein